MAVYDHSNIELALQGKQLGLNVYQLSDCLQVSMFQLRRWLSRSNSAMSQGVDLNEYFIFGIFNGLSDQELIDQWHTMTRFKMYVIENKVLDTYLTNLREQINLFYEWNDGISFTDLSKKSDKSLVSLKKEINNIHNYYRQYLLAQLPKEKVKEDMLKLLSTSTSVMQMKLLQLLAEQYNINSKELAWLIRHYALSFDELGLDSTSLYLRTTNTRNAKRVLERIDKEVADRIIELFKQDTPMYKIAEQLNVNIKDVAKIVYIQEEYKLYLKDKMSEITKELYLKGIPCANIAKYMNVSSRALSSLLQTVEERPDFAQLIAQMDIKVLSFDQVMHELLGEHAILVYTQSKYYKALTAQYYHCCYQDKLDKLQWLYSNGISTRVIASYYNIPGQICKLLLADVTVKHTLEAYIQNHITPQHSSRAVIEMLFKEDSELVFSYPYYYKIINQLDTQWLQQYHKEDVVFWYQRGIRASQISEYLNVSNPLVQSIVKDIPKDTITDLVAHLKMAFVQKQPMGKALQDYLGHSCDIAYKVPSLANQISKAHTEYVYFFKVLCGKTRTEISEEYGVSFMVVSRAVKEYSDLFEAMRKEYLTPHILIADVVDIYPYHQRISSVLRALSKAYGMEYIELWDKATAWGINWDAVIEHQVDTTVAY